MHLSHWYVVLVCHQYDVCENSAGSVYGILSESGLCVFRELCPVSFLIVGECPSVLLQSVVMLIVVMMGRWYVIVRVELSTMSDCIAWAMVWEGGVMPVCVVSLDYLC